MVPQRCVVCAALPLTSNGKIDRQALLAKAASQAAADHPSVSMPVLQDDPVLETMCALWRSVLQCDEVGPDDDFFALGGDSIMAIQIVGRARAHGLALSSEERCVGNECVSTF